MSADTWIAHPGYRTTAPGIGGSGNGAGDSVVGGSAAANHAGGRTGHPWYWVHRYDILERNRVGTTCRGRRDVIGNIHRRIGSVHQRLCDRVCCLTGNRRVTDTSHRCPAPAKAAAGYRRCDGIILCISAADHSCCRTCNNRRLVDHYVGSYRRTGATIYGDHKGVVTCVRHIRVRYNGVLLR